jgi:aquaglyceroporin related protein
MGEQHRDEPLRSPPGPQLHPIEERDTSPNSSASTETLAASPKKQTDEPHTPGPSKQQIELEQQKQQKPQNDNLSTPLNEQPPPLSSRPSVAREPTESGSVYYGHQAPSLANRTWSQHQASQWPTHSLAGKNMMPDQAQPSQNNVYIDPEYRQKNPRYGRENEKPIWGLAKPLPRVIRPGMRRDEKSQTAAQQFESPGESAPAPELGATPGLSSPQPGATPGQGHPTYSSTAQQGLEKQHAVYAPQADGLLRPMESEAGQDYMPPGTNQPMEEQSQEEFLNLWVKIRHYMKEPFAEFLAVSFTTQNRNISC